MEELKPPITPPQISLRLSEKGELRLNGEATAKTLKTILEASIVQSEAYRVHQAKLDTESNLMSIYLGIIFASFLGLTVFCLFNLNTLTPSQPQSKNHAQQLIS